MSFKWETAEFLEKNNLYNVKKIKIKNTDTHLAVRHNSVNAGRAKTSGSAKQWLPMIH